MGEVGRGTKVFDAAPVRGRWRRFEAPEDVLRLLDAPDSAPIVAVVADAGATFLAPVFEDLTAVICLSGTPLSHIGIVAREYRVPCLMGTTLTEEPSADTEVEVDCSGSEGVVRVP